MTVILASGARIYGTRLKAWQLEQLSLSGLAQRDLPVPQPKGREVLVRIRATSVNPRDVGLAIGAYGPQALPLVPLADGAGEVVAVGPEVTRVAVGARVIGTFVHGWIAGPPRRELAATTLGGPRPGTLAEFAVFEDTGIVVIPEALSFLLPEMGLDAAEQLGHTGATACVKLGAEARAGAARADVCDPAAGDICAVVTVEAREPDRPVLLGACGGRDLDGLRGRRVSPERASTQRGLYRLRCGRIPGAD